jgi:hypothetical protein
MSAHDHVDDLLLREHRRREITERLYATFLQLADGVPEEEWRLLNIECVTRLAGGLGASIRGDASAREFGLARCGHCEALLSPKDAKKHVCDPADLERIKKNMLAHVPHLLQRPVRIALGEEHFRALVAGKEVKIDDPAALLILSDIGFRVMKDAIRVAEEKR